MYIFPKLTKKIVNKALGKALKKNLEISDEVLYTKTYQDLQYPIFPFQTSLAPFGKSEIRSEFQKIRKTIIIVYVVLSLYSQRTFELHYLLYDLPLIQF